MVRVSKSALALCLALASLAPNSDAFSVSASSRGASGVAFVTAAPASARRHQHATASLSMADDDESSSSSSSSSSGGGGSTLERLPESAVQIIIPVPGSATKAAYDRACTEMSKSVSIPGFRKGAKIPPAVIESTLAQRGAGKNALREQAVQSLVSQLVEPALKDEHDLDPIGTPVLNPGAAELAESFVPGEDLELKVRCDVWPEIVWGAPPAGAEKSYHGLTGTYKRKPFDEERFQKALTDLRDRYATLSPAEEGTALGMGDACVIDMVGYMANDDGTKGEPLPDAASGDDVEVVLGDGRYMEGLVEGLLGAKVGDDVVVSVSFPEGLRDKTLAGKKAVFDVTVKEASHRHIPEVTDEFAEKVRKGLTADALKEELRKAVDQEDAKEFVNERNDALGKALAEVVDVDVPDTLVTNQAREKFAMMMTDFRDQGMDDNDIKLQITPENFLKYKNISKDGIVRDFKISMAVDEVARMEGIDVPADQVDEQIGALRKEMAEAGQSDEDMDENSLRAKVESTLQRRLVFDYLSEYADLDVEYDDNAGQELDVDMLNDIAAESLAREKGITIDEAKAEIQGEQQRAAEEAAAAAEVEVEVEPAEVEVEVEVEVDAAAETPAAVEEQVAAEEEETASDEDKASTYGNMDVEERAFTILSDLGMLENSPDPDDPNYDSSGDDEIAAENVFPE
mmetsp:Transcript_22006/g.65159  ORF Transcript_22006/g.65159 Transcript_22006/m.65159 type:complete len:685 (-) Transcript_22006:492-2546(-)